MSGETLPAPGPTWSSAVAAPAEVVEVATAEAGGDEQSRARGRGRAGRPWVFGGTLTVVLLLLFGVPWWTLVAGGGWPAPVVAVGSVVFGMAVVAFPALMFLGHRRGGRDWAARIADTTLGVVWVLFVWSAFGTVLRLGLAAAGVAAPDRSRIVSVTVAVVSLVLLAWGTVEARRVPRIKRLDVVLPRLGRGLDGTQVAILTDTHYGPINRTRWSTKVAAAVNDLRPDIVIHAGDIADGTAAQRHDQSAPLGTVTSTLATVYVTGNHEYYGEALGWVERMNALGWEFLHNRHLVLTRGGDRLVLAGIDDATAAGSGLAGHRANLAQALTGADPDLPVLLVAHQPRQVEQAVAAQVDLQVSGHTHGGQIWPFHYLVRTDQPSVSGLSRHGDRTQLYTSRGTGFWGPPLRIFAPSEITLLTLRTA